MTPSLPFKSLAVVLNPLAGSGRALRQWPRLEAALHAHNLPFTWLSAASAEDALLRVQTLPPDVAVLAVGGDGTVSGLLPALVNTDRLLGIVPLGTGNDFAGMLGLKPGDFDTTLSRLKAPPRATDALHVAWTDADGTHQRWLLNGLGMGFDAQVAARLENAPARFSGFGRYLWAALGAVRHLQTESVDISVDGQPFYAGPSVLAAVMNGTRYGGGFLISPQSDAFDGQLNVVLGERVSRPALLALMLKVSRGRHLTDARVKSRSGQHVTVRWQTPLATHLDGDVIAPQRELSVRIVPGAVQLLSAP